MKIYLQLCGYYILTIKRTTPEWSTPGYEFLTSINEFISHYHGKMYCCGKMYSPGILIATEIKLASLFKMILKPVILVKFEAINICVEHNIHWMQCVCLELQSSEVSYPLCTFYQTPI